MRPDEISNVEYSRIKRVPHIFNEILIHLVRSKPEDVVLSLLVFLQSGAAKERLSRDPSWWPKEHKVISTAGLMARHSSAASWRPRTRWPRTLSRTLWPRDACATQDKPRPPRPQQWPHVLSPAVWPRGDRWPATLSEELWQRPTGKLPRRYHRSQPPPRWPQMLSIQLWPRRLDTATLAALYRPTPPPPPGVALEALMDVARRVGGTEFLRLLDPAAPRHPGEGLAALEAAAPRGLHAPPRLAALCELSGAVLRGDWPYCLSTDLWSRPRGIAISAAQGRRPDAVSWPHTLSEGTWRRPWSTPDADADFLSELLSADGEEAEQPRPPSAPAPPEEAGEGEGEGEGHAGGGGEEEAAPP
eukprot:TRINITY_DN18080_c0_g1_i1.p1 TRINITY_DN18080_c0_g1~~TRINITY_DN18080_c0_g1_i1.p1  ORF type:complete len:382 (+),score=98.38 TRINITY_DN18080_c0_g1_i1:71-1147(+)